MISRMMAVGVGCMAVAHIFRVAHAAEKAIRGIDGCFRLMNRIRQRQTGLKFHPTIRLILSGASEICLRQSKQVSVFLMIEAGFVSASI